MDEHIIVGHTGFVGGVLQGQRFTSQAFNSTNFRDMRGVSAPLLVCAGVRAEKWKANAEPQTDWNSIQNLWDVMRSVRAHRFVLISTVDVYPQPNLVDEGFRPHGLANHAYGQHRLALEEMVLANFPRAVVLRLPALFGPGLRKNVLFDMKNARLLDGINPDSSFQWYDVRRLWADIDLALDVREGGIFNLVTRPISVRRLRDTLFPGLEIGAKASAPVSYDVRTLHAKTFGGTDGYLEDEDMVLQRMDHWLSSESA